MPATPRDVTSAATVAATLILGARNRSVSEVEAQRCYAAGNQSSWIDFGLAGSV